MVTAAVHTIRKSAVQPDPGAIHVNRPLTTISTAYDADTAGYVANKIFPVVDVEHQSDSYYTYDRSYLLRNEVKERAPQTESAGIGWERGTATYLAKRYSIHDDIPDEERANDDVGESDEAATTLVTQQMWLHREISFAAKAMITGVWGTDVAGVSGVPAGAQVKQWNDAAATPVADIRKYSTVMQSATGRRGSRLVLGREAWEALIEHPTIIDRIKYGQTPGNAALADMETVAKLMGLEQVLVMDGIYNAAKEGATPVYAFIGGKKALLVNVPPRPAKRTPSAGYTFNWRGLTGASGDAGIRIKKFRMEHLSADRVEADSAYDQKVVAPDLGVFFNTLVA